VIEGIKKPSLTAPRNYKCPVCGTMVVYPCYLCGVRANKRAEKLANRQRPQYVAPLDTPLAKILSAKLANEMELQGWIYVGDMQGVTRARLLLIPGIGEHCVRTIARAISAALTA